MAKTDIPSLPNATLPLAGTESVIVQQSGFTREATAKDIIEASGSRTVPGAWAFSTSPVVPTPASGTSATNKDYVDGVAAGVPTGVFMPYGGAVAPTGWLLCDGTAVSRSTYSGLFTAIGTAYGTGDGSTTFNLPDMRAASPVGSGTSTGYTQNETISLGTKYNDQMHAHWHANYQAPSGGTTALMYDSARGTPSGLTTQNVTREAVTDGVNGTPRTGNVTRGKVVGVNYIIKT